VGILKEIKTLGRKPRLKKAGKLVKRNAQRRGAKERGKQNCDKVRGVIKRKGRRGITGVASNRVNRSERGS